MEGLYSLNAIAKANGLTYPSLKTHYDSTLDIHKAVKLAKEKQKIRQGRVIWDEKPISLVKLASDLGLSNTTLTRYYNETNDINTAVALTKKAHNEHFESVEIDDEKKSIGKIAKENGLVDHILMHAYKETGDIHLAIQKAKENQVNFHGKILYEKDGKLHTANYIANDNKIHSDTFKKYYKKTGNPAKAILLSKEGQRRYNKNKTDKQTKPKELMDYFSLEKTETKLPVSQQKKNEVYQKDEQSLFSYCLENSLNYDVILNLIHTYSMPVDDAIIHYRKYGQEIPTNWIYEKYDVLFRHLMLSYQIRSDRVIKIMKEENCNVFYALEKYIFTEENKDFTSAEVSLLFEIYQVKKVCTPEEYEQVKKEFYITQNELEFISQKEERIEYIQIKLLLFEFSQIIDLWNEEDVFAMMGECSITEEEVVEICSALYTNFSNKVLSGDLSKERKEANLRTEFIKDSYKDDEITLNMKLINSNLEQADKEKIVECIGKIQKFTNGLDSKKQK